MFLLNQTFPKAYDGTLTNNIWERVDYVVTQVINFVSHQDVNTVRNLIILSMCVTALGLFRLYKNAEFYKTRGDFWREMWTNSLSKLQEKIKIIHCLEDSLFECQSKLSNARSEQLDREAIAESLARAIAMLPQNGSIPIVQELAKLGELFDIEISISEANNRRKQPKRAVASKKVYNDSDSESDDKTKDPDYED